MPQVIQGQRTGRVLRAPGDFRRPTAPKCLAPAPARQCPELGPPFLSAHSWQMGPAGLLGANPKPRSAARSTWVIQGRRTGRALRAPGDFRRPPAPKRLGPCSRSPAASPRSALPLGAQLVDRACWTPGSNPNTRSAPEGPFARGLAPQLWGLGTPEPQLRTQSTAPPPPGPLRALSDIWAGERAETSEPLEMFESTPR